MNEFERRIWRQVHSLIDGFSKWWGSLRESDVGKRAASAVHDVRESDAAKRAASAVHDVRESDAAKRAATRLNDLRDTDAAKRAASALADLRQRESVRKAEESARRALHDLRSGRGTGGSTTDS
jgi:hypothetical protein